MVLRRKKLMLLIVGLNKEDSDVKYYHNILFERSDFWIKFRSVSVV